jgi:hypothetical protein
MTVMTQGAATEGSEAGVALREYAQTLETSVIDKEHGFAAHFAWLPRRVVVNVDSNGKIGFSNWALNLFPAVTFAVFDNPGELPQVFRNMMGSDIVRNPEQDVQVQQFSQYLAFAEIIPIQASPLDLHSLASLLAGASPVGVGVLVGFASGGGIQSIASGGDHLLLITVPAGILLCSAAARLGPGAADVVLDASRKVLGLPTHR